MKQISKLVLIITFITGISSAQAELGMNVHVSGKQAEHIVEKMKETGAGECEQDENVGNVVRCISHAINCSIATNLHGYRGRKMADAYHCTLSI